MNDLVTLVILNDGSTYTDVSGCTLAVVTREDYEKMVESSGEAKDLTPVVEISLQDITIR